MLLTYIVRGNAIEFDATFADVDGVLVSPDTAILKLSFMDNGVRAIETLDMDENTDGTFIALWDSSVADKGRVHWSVRTTNPPSAQDGQFELAANLANSDETTA